MNAPGDIDIPLASIAPGDAGFDANKLARAVTFIADNETPWPRALSQEKTLPGLTELEPPPWNEIIGPVQDRGGPAGLILRAGRTVAHWGDIARTDMTFSVAKSYLAVLAGVAFGDGLIADLDAPVSDSLAIEEFASPHNRRITWRHLLQQTSEWQGTLFSKPDTVDHHRVVSGGDNSKKGTPRQLQTPGSYHEYNDVRVNVLSLALLHLFRQPLPEVLTQRIMEPIGASDTWSWHAYRNAVIEIDGVAMPSVPGGSHWGGGLWISALDHARFGLLMARDGVWQGRRLLPDGWVDAMWTPQALKPDYGMLWWPNADQAMFPDLPAQCAAAVGAGGHLIFIDTAADLVVVARWLDVAARATALRGIYAALA